jgi:hypothetical protein
MKMASSKKAEMIQTSYSISRNSFSSKQEALFTECKLVTDSMMQPIDTLCKRIRYLAARIVQEQDMQSSTTLLVHILP